MLSNDLCPALSLFSFSSPFSPQVHNEFILSSERDGFIHRIQDIIKRAESLMGKDLAGQQGKQEAVHFPQHNTASSISSSQVKSAWRVENGGAGVAERLS